MNDDITGLRKKINDTAEDSDAKVDDLNRLSSLLFENAPQDAFDVAERAIVIAQKIQYKAGEALALVHAGMYFSANRKYAEARDYYTKAKKLRLDIVDDEGLATIYAKIGNTYLYDGQYPEALQEYSKAQTIREKLNDFLGAADLYTNSAIVYGLQGNYPLALEWHLQALKIYEGAQYHTRIAASCSNIGLIYVEQKNYEEALKMFKHALAIREQNNDKRDIGIQLNNIGYAYQELKQLDHALEYHQRALELRLQLGDQAKLATTYSNLGNVYKLKGDHDKAYDFYHKALSIFETLNEKRGLVQSYNNMGEHFFEIHKPDEAHFYLNKAIKLAEETGLKNQLSVALDFSSQVYAQQGEYEKAYLLHKRHMNLDKEITNTETTMRLAQMTARHEIEKKEREAEIQRLKNVELTKAYNLLEEAKQRSEELLLNILPAEVSEELKQYGKTKARSYNSVTVLFADIKGFTKISEQFSAEEIVSGIDEYFEEFDKLMSIHGVEKIKTIGDAYLAVCGVPVPDNDHACKMVSVAVDFVNVVHRLKEKREKEGKQSFDFRIGLHSGPIVAGVVGSKKFAYDIWGDTVNTASRMQSNSEPNRINISESTYQLVRHLFRCEYRGEIDAKNKGLQKMYFVV